LYIGSRWGISILDKPEGTKTITISIDDNIDIIIVKGAGA